jgi:hypothetical protein
VAQQAQPETKLQLGKVLEPAQGISHRKAADRDQTDKIGTTVVTLLTAEASIPEEPGAGKPHAGI